MHDTFEQTRANPKSHHYYFLYPYIDYKPVIVPQNHMVILPVERIN
jgi:hypothetical protein